MVRKISSQSGSAIWFILIAIVLFAALSAAVSFSGSGGGNAEHIQEDKARILSDELLNYGRLVSEAVSALRLDGCTMEQISFEGGTTAVTGYTNATNNGNAYCQIFAREGGGLNWPDFSPDLFNAGASVTDRGHPIFTIKNAIPELGTTEYELVMLVKGLEQPVCEVINDKIHGDPTINSANDSEVKYEGTINTTNVYTFPAVFNGLRQACYQDNGGADSGTYTYYYVVSVR